MKELFVVMCTLYFLSGCVSNPDYPDSWAEISSDRYCQEINGKFRNAGINQDGHEVRLYSYLFGEISTEVDYIEMLTSNNEITVSAYSKGKLVKEHIEDIAERSCNNGLLEIDISASEDGIDREGVVGYVLERNRFSISESNDLIIHRSSTGAVLVFIIPVVGSIWSWAKFSEIN